MKAIQKLHSGLAIITKYVSWVGLAATFFLMVVTTVDVIIRALSKAIPGLAISGIKGSYDMTEMGMVIIVFFGIAFYQSQHGHVRVEMFVEKFPYTVRCIVEGFANLLEAVFGVLLCYAAFQQISTLYTRGVGTSTIHIPHWPLAVFMTVGMLLFTIFLVLDGILAFMKIAHGPEQTK